MAVPPRSPMAASIARRDRCRSSRRPSASAILVGRGRRPLAPGRRARVRHRPRSDVRARRQAVHAVRRHLARRRVHLQQRPDQRRLGRDAAARRTKAARRSSRSSPSPTRSTSARSSCCADRPSLGLGFGQAPLAAFSDGERAFAIFARVTPLLCPDEQREHAACPGADGFTCSEQLGVCDPALSTITLVCDRATQTGCFPGQDMHTDHDAVRRSSSSQHDGTIVGEMASVVQENEIARAARGRSRRSSTRCSPGRRASSRTRPRARSSASAAATKAATTARVTATCWSSAGPGMFAEHGREAPALPAEAHAAARARRGRRAAVRAAYYAGIDTQSGEPCWSESHADAAAARARRRGRRRPARRAANRRHHGRELARRRRSTSG